MYVHTYVCMYLAICFLVLLRPSAPVDVAEPSQGADEPRRKKRVISKAFISSSEGSSSDEGGEEGPEGVATSSGRPGAMTTSSSESSDVESDR